MRLAVASRRTCASPMPCPLRSLMAPMVDVQTARSQATEHGIRISRLLILRFPHILWQQSMAIAARPRPTLPSPHPTGRTSVTSPRTLRNFIGGTYVDADAGATSDVVEPVDRPGRGPRARSAGREEVDAAYEAADRAFGEWGRTTPSERQQALLKFADAIEAHAEELIDLESENTGKIKALTASEEIPPMVDQLRFFAGAARVLEGKAAGEYMAGHTSWVRREPIGVVGQVTPWNYPLLMAVWKIGPALAAGNTVVLKPSDTTPESTLRLAELASEFLPAGHAQRRHRRPRDRAPPRRAPDPEPGRDHRLGPRRRRGRGQRRPAGQAGAPRARRQGAGRGLRRRRHRGRRRGHRDRRLLQRRPGLHRRHPRAGRPRHPRRLRRRAGRLREELGTGRPARRRGRPLRPGQQRHASWPG